MSDQGGLFLETIAEQAAGRAMSLEQAAAYARQLQIYSEAPPQNEEKLSALTSREREVTALSAQGKSTARLRLNW